MKGQAVLSKNTGEEFQSPVSGHWFVDTTWSYSIEGNILFQSPVSGHWFVDLNWYDHSIVEDIKFQSPVSGHWFVDTHHSRTVGGV